MSIFKNNPALRGIVLLLTAVLILSIQDVIIKSMSSDFALLQVLVIRCLISLPFVLLYIHFNGGWETLRPKIWRLQFWRGAWMFTAYIFFFLGLPALPYNLVTVIFFVSPLFMTALSVILLGEIVGWQRWAAVSVGFLGLLVVINPLGTQATFNFAMILILISALCYAFSITLNRKIEDSDATTAFYTMLVYFIGGSALTPFAALLDIESAHPSLVFLTNDWVSLDLSDVLIFVTISLCWSIGMVLLSAAYRSTSVAILAPFEYFAVLYGLALGYLVWGEIPASTTLIGLILIVGSGLFIVYRENRPAVPIPSHS